MLKFGIVEVFSAQPVPEFFARITAPGRIHLLATESEEILHGSNSGGMEALFHAGTDAGQIARFEPQQGCLQDVRRKGYETIWLLHIGGDLGQVAVRGEPYGASQRGSGIL